MFAPFLATLSRNPHPASESTSDASPYHPTTWGVRAVQIVLAVYLLPVLALMLLIGGVGMAIAGLAALMGRALRQGPNPSEVEEYAPRS